MNMMSHLICHLMHHMISHVMSHMMSHAMSHMMGDMIELHGESSTHCVIVCVIVPTWVRLSYTCLIIGVIFHLIVPSEKFPSGKKKEKGNVQLKRSPADS